MTGSVQRKGPTTWRGRIRSSVAQWLTRNVFERGDFIATGPEVRLETYGLDTPDRFRYVPTGRFVIPRLLRKIGAGSDDVFIDVGSGKGRVVYQTARFPLKRVIGLELSDELNQVARYNIEHNRDRLVCDDVQIITGDALEYRFPDDITIAYFYHPFGGETFERVIDNLIASVDRSPRQIWLIYGYPLMAEYIHRTGRFELTGKMRSWRWGIREFHEFLVFRSQPSTTPA